MALALYRADGIGNPVRMAARLDREVDPLRKHDIKRSASQRARRHICVSELCLTVPTSAKDVLAYPPKVGSVGMDAELTCEQLNSFAEAVR